MWTPKGIALKFLCDNCKAKYQIPDERVAGKTVRMKCRKCGHQIEVRAEVTETSVSTAPPKSGSAPPAPAIARPAPLGVSAPRPRPAAPTAATAGSTGALAGAFQRALADKKPEPPSALDLLDLSLSEEWYAAIGGVAVGPIRVAELRRKASTGALTEDSLVWQEGLEEWRAVRSIPELARLVREAAAPSRPSLVTPPAPEGRTSAPPPAPAGQSTQPLRTGAQRPMGPARPAEPMRPAARSNVVPLSASRGATAEKLDVAMQERTMALANAPPRPAGIPSPLGDDPVPAHPSSSAVLAAPVADPFAVPGLAASAADFGAVSAATPLSAPPPAKKAGPPWWFILVAVFVGCFGIAVAIIVFLPKPQATVGPAATVTVTVIQSAPPPPTAEAPPDTSATVATTAKPTTGGPVAVAAKTAPAPSSTGRAAADLGSLLGSSGSTGPNVGSGPAGPSAGGGGTLDEAAIMRTVNGRKAGIKRSCIDRAGAQASTVKVTANITIAPNGTVQNVTASGDDPVAAKCMESQIRTWTFAPPPGETKSVSIPFVFVRQ
jgi:predicted Zn finger-like uncharacterized protein